MKVDIGEGSGWSLNELTDAVSRKPVASRQVSELLDWEEKGIRTKTASIDVKDGQIDVIDDAPYNGVGQELTIEDADTVTISVPSHTATSHVMAEEVGGRRAFGTEAEVETVEMRRQEHVEFHAESHSLTRETDRIGALQALILRRDGSVKRNLGQAMGKTPTELPSFPWDDVDADVTEYFNELADMLGEQCGSLVINGFLALTTSKLFGKVRANKKRKEELRYVDPKGLRETQTNGLVINNKVTMVQYSNNFIIPRSGGRRAFPDDKILMLPIARGLYKSYFAPAQTLSLVNSVGLPVYMWSKVDEDDFGLHLKSQSNHLPIVTQPECIGIIPEED
jgi:hypothetical protein